MVLVALARAQAWHQLGAAVPCQGCALLPCSQSRGRHTGPISCRSPCFPASVASVFLLLLLQDVGQSLVAKMDQGYLLRSNRRAGSPPVQLAKLLSAKEAQGRYYIDYTVQKEGEEARTVCSAVALGYNGLQVGWPAWLAAADAVRAAVHWQV